MRKKIRTTAAIASLLAACLTLSGCSLLYSSETTEDGWEIGYSKWESKCFLITRRWDGEENSTTFTLPDEYLGYPVTALGGYVGRGFPCPFQIGMPEGWAPGGYPIASVWGDEPTEELFPEGITLIDLTFTLKIGKNLAVLYYKTSEYYVTEPKEDGSRDAYRIVYRYECPEENGTFYSEDGKLYLKKTGEEAEWKYGV